MVIAMMMATMMMIVMVKLIAMMMATKKLCSQKHRLPSATSAHSLTALEYQLAHGDDDVDVDVVDVALVVVVGGGVYDDAHDGDVDEEDDNINVDCST